MPVRRPPGGVPLAGALLGLALALAGCGRLGQDTAAVMAAHEVVERELPVKHIEFHRTAVLEKAPPWYLLQTDIEIETAEGLHDRGSLLVILALNPDNGIEYRYHPGVALARLRDPANPSPEQIQALKARNGWGAPVRW